MQQTIAALKNSVALEHYSPEDLIDWASIEDSLLRLQYPLRLIEALPKDLNVDELARLLETEALCYEVIKRLLSITAEVGFVDGSILPAKLPSSQNGIHQVAHNLLRLGLHKLTKDAGELRTALKVSLVTSDAESRRFRLAKKQERRLLDVVRSAIHGAETNLGIHIDALSKDLFPPEAVKKVDYVLAVEGVPKIAITSVFQAQSGGRQARDLSFTYPALQTRLYEIPLELVVIVDGKGIKEASDHSLGSLFSGVSSCISYAQAEQGMLEAEMIRLISTGSHRRLDDSAILELINTTLFRVGSVKAGDLPIPEEKARLALAKFSSANSNYALDISEDATTLSWSRALAAWKPSEGSILGLFCQLVNFEQQQIDETSWILLNTSPDRVLKPRTFARLVSGAISEEVIRDIAAASLRHCPGNATCILFSENGLSDSEISKYRPLQRTLPVSVVILTNSQFLTIARSSKAVRDSLISIIRLQADLTKLSPFVTANYTPSAMFFGREAEESSIISTVRSHSIAVLGSRKIGKTSLIKHVMRRLSQAGTNTYYGDCQTVRNWDDFRTLAKREWGVDCDANFDPQNLFHIATQLSQTSKGPTVIFLDEIDFLLDWDQSQHHNEQVPEAFFRALRSVSQSGKAQFVFSGERVIASKLWDPQSPHWNFCMPLTVKQLTRKATAELLFEPIRQLQMEFEDEEEVEAMVWNFTSGHPQIAQYLGTMVVSHINDNPARDSISSKEIDYLINSYEFVEHYLGTYLGQSTPLERLIVALLATDKPPTLDVFEEYDLRIDEGILAKALRMLDLYGIIERSGTSMVFRAEWFPRALSMYGDPNARIEHLVEQIKQ